MFKQYVVPFFAVLGFIFAAKTVVGGNKKPPVAEPFVQPASAPYAKFVAGTGILEPSSENIAVATLVSGVVVQVPVTVGQEVKKGQLLFALDTRDLEAELAVRQATVKGTETDLQTAQNLLSMRLDVNSKGAVSKEDLILKKAGVASAEARLQQDRSRIAQIQTEIERRQVRAPLDAVVLQLKIRVGEYASAQVLSQPLLVLGQISPLHVRVDVDENDAWRVQQGAGAVASLRGNKDLTMDMEFVRFEPYVVPKRSLSGDSSERVDTRVLQIVYRVKKVNFPLLVGQLVDVYIESQK